jgi:aminoglycoside 6-adenylyltransferase
MEQFSGSEALIASVITWAGIQEDIRLMAVIGSRSRKDVPADKWSDWDLMLVTTHPERYIKDGEWLNGIHKFHLTFLEQTPIGGLVERRVLFDGGHDVDFIPVPYQLIRDGIPPGAENVLRKGYMVLIDKDGLASKLPHDFKDFKNYSKPSEREFLQLLNDFLYHVLWTAKKLCRGEVWTAKMCCDGSMKWQLLKLIEWHEQLINNVDTWHSGRLIERWVSPHILEDLRNTFSRYDPKEQWDALYTTLRVFRSLGCVLAEKFDYEYPFQADEYITGLIKDYQKANQRPNEQTT